MDEKKKIGTLKEELPKGDTKDKNEGHKNSGVKSELEKYIAEAIAKERASWEKGLEERIASEREDAAKLASMTSEERAAAAMEKKQKDFENERQLYLNERAEIEAAKELAGEGLPVTFAKMVADADSEVMSENIRILKSEYMKAIEEGLSQRLKGGLPRISKEKETAGDPFLNGLGM